MGVLKILSPTKKIITLDKSCLKHRFRMSLSYDYALFSYRLNHILNVKQMSPHGVLSNVLDSHIIVSEFELQSRFLFTLGLISLRIYKLSYSHLSLRLFSVKIRTLVRGGSYLSEEVQVRLYYSPSRLGKLKVCFYAQIWRFYVNLRISFFVLMTNQP